MARLFGVTFPDEKRIEYALTLLYGISFSRANIILLQAQIDKNKRVKELSDADLKKIQDIIDKNYKVEGDLKEEIAANIKRLKEIGSYRGSRHIKSLPVRGQRTKSNARTKRGKRKTIGAIKKEDAIKKQPSAAAAEAKK